MTVDPAILEALKTELRFAKQTAPGGQKPNQSRIKDIEAAIAAYDPKPAPAPVVNESEKSTDYESNDDDRVTKARAAREKPETTRGRKPAESTEA